MKKTLKIVGIVVVAALVIAQVFRPDRENPAETTSQTLEATLPVPPAVKAILDGSCKDCHSNRTQWPWYSAVAPASWLVASDVREGREHLNFSEWGTYKRGRMIARLDGIVSEVDKGEMPLSQYLLIHPDAKISQEQKAVLCSWAEQMSDSLGSLDK